MIQADTLNEVAELARFPELSPHPILRFSSDGAFLFANPAGIKAFSEQIAQAVRLGVIFPEIQDLNLRRIIDKDLTVSVKVSHASSFYQAHIRGVSDSDFINIYLNDITNLERIKNEIEEDRVETEQLIASIKSILVGLDNEGYITRWNAVAESAFSLKASEAITKHVDECIYTWSLGTFDVIKDLMQGEKDLIVEDARFQKIDIDQEGHLDIAITRVVGQDQSPSGYLILGRDITERKELEIQLLQAQKLESLGQLAAGIAHEINTPIQFVGDNTHFLATAFKRLDKVLELSEQFATLYKDQQAVDGLIEEMETTMKKAKIGYMRSEIPYAIEEMLKGLEQVASIVKGMKQFSHPGSSEKKLSSINECIRNTITVSRNEWKYVADLETNLDDSIPAVMCHVNEINQVILNMIVNAAHAIEKAKEDGLRDKGKITLATHSEQEKVIIEISDTGTGIHEEIISKIFDPFFTTKEPGKGTGQGLSISHNVIRNNGGAIFVKSVVGEGTTFTIELPAHVQA